jgi:integrase
MARNAVGLTDAKIKTLKAPEHGQAEHPDSVVPGLRVRVGASGAKTFILRKRVAGRLRNMALGRYNETRFTLADARKKARSLLSDIEAGGDPTPTLRTRHQSRAGQGTIRALYDDYRRAKAHLRSHREVDRIFNRHILPALGDRLADTVTRGDVTRLVDGIEARSMARAVAAQLSSFYSWALPRLDRLPANPCRDAGKPPKARARDRVLTTDELRALWKVLESEPAPFGPAIRLLLLTLQRREEVFSADCSEFDLSSRVWTIPAQRAKNGVAHIVPLSDAAVVELETLLAGHAEGKLFPARGNPQNGPSGISKAWARIRDGVQERLGRSLERFTIHDLRRTGATGLQRLGIRLEVTEAVLNHISGSRGGIVGVYQRHHFTDEKRFALNAWASDLQRIVHGESAVNRVASIRT